MNFVDVFNPATLLGDRLGLTLYALFVEAYLAGDYAREAELYRKFIRHFPGERKIHTPETFIGLIESVRQGGFDPHLPVYANPDEYALVEGSHRCAIAIQLGVTEVPYNLRFSDDRVDNSVFDKIFSPPELAHLHAKREEYIARLDPELALRCRIRSVMRTHPGSFQAPFSSRTKIPALRTYQGFERLGISGKRPSGRRMGIYRLERYLEGTADALEIGCNVGFFTLHLASLVRSMLAFDLDPNYIEVAKLVREHEGQHNCEFLAQALGDFCPDRRFGFVVSTAVHGWSGLPFAQFLAMLDGLLEPGGILLFESHEIDAEGDWREKRGELTGRFNLLDSGLIDDVDKTMYASEMREYLILQKSGC